MTVGDVWYWVSFLFKKQNSGLLQPNNFNLALQVVNTDFWRLKVGLTQEYKPGSPLPRQAYEVSKRITDDIRQWRVYAPIAVVNGTILPPITPAQGYAAFSSMGYYRYIQKRGVTEPKWTSIEVLTDEDYNSRKESRLLNITYKSPIASFQNGGWAILPNNIPSVFLTYLRFPIQPVFGFTIDPVSDQVVYNPGTSVQLDMPQEVHSDFAIAVAAYLGIYIGDPERSQLVGKRVATGQS